LRWFRLHRDQIHNDALILANHSGVRFACEISDGCRTPVVASRKGYIGVHPLLDHRPFSSFSHDETVEVELEAVSNSIVIYPRGKPTASHKRLSVETG
jgi:hypothetical protein